MLVPSSIHTPCACAIASVPMYTGMRDAAPSPPCGPAAVTNVPRTSTRNAIDAIAVAAWRSPTGARTSSGSLRSACTAATASAISTIETRKWIDTVYHCSPVRTVMPPITACVSTPSGRIQATRRTTVAIPVLRRTSHRNHSVAPSTTNVRSRLPNSMPACRSSNGFAVGVKLSGSQRGHSAQPRPDPLTRTTPPVTTMPMLVSRAA